MIEPRDWYQMEFQVIDTMPVSFCKNLYYGLFSRWQTIVDIEGWNFHKELQLWKYHYGIPSIISIHNFHHSDLHTIPPSIPKLPVLAFFHGEPPAWISNSVFQFGKYLGVGPYYIVHQLIFIIGIIPFSKHHGNTTNEASNWILSPMESSVEITLNEFPSGRGSNVKILFWYSLLVPIYVFSLCMFHWHHSYGIPFVTYSMEIFINWHVQYWSSQEREISNFGIF